MDFRKLFLPALLAAAPLAAQDCTVNFKLPAAGNSAVFDNRTKGCATWAVTFNATGFSALTLTVQGAPDAGGAPGTFGTVTAAAGSNPSTAVTQASATFAAYFPWMRVNLSGLTGTGSVTGTLYGWRIGAQAGAAGGGGGGGGGAVWGPDAPGSAPTQPPVQAGLFDGTNIRRLLGTSAGRLVNQPKTVSLALADGLSNTQPAMQGDDSGNTTPVFPAFTHLFNGTTWDRARGNTNGAIVQGAAAIGSANSSNPIVIAGHSSGTSTVRAFRTDTSGFFPLQGAAITFTDAMSNGGNVISNNEGNNTISRSYNFLFNGSTWDRMRGNATAGLQVGGLGSGASGTLYQFTACDQSAQAAIAATATTQLVALVSGRRVRVCSYQISAANSTSTAQFVEGTGTNCGTGTANLSPAFNMAANSGYTRGSGIGELFATSTANALCLSVTAGTAYVWITYAVY